MQRDPGSRPAVNPTPRVAVVVNQLGYGGAERQTVELLRQLRGSAWAPSLVICLSDDLEPYGTVIQSYGYELAVLPRGASFDLGRLVRLRRLFQRHRIGLVHAINLEAAAYTWLARWPGRRPRLLPSIRSATASPGRLRSAIYRRMFQSCSHSLCNSARGAGFITRSFQAPPDRIVVVPNGVDFAALRARAHPGELRRELGLRETTPLIGYVGRDTRVKNVPRFLQIVRDMLPEIKEAHAVLAGAGLGTEARARWAADLPEDRVHFLGARSDVPTLIRDCSVLVLTSDSEGCPNVVLEALGLGTPVVSSDVGDVALMLRERSIGRVVPPQDLAGFRSAISEILGDNERARAAVERSWPRLEKAYSVRSMVDSTVELWEKILSV